MDNVGKFSKLFLVKGYMVQSWNFEPAIGETVYLLINEIMIKAVLFDFDGVIGKDKDDLGHLKEIVRGYTEISNTKYNKAVKKYFSLPIYLGQENFQDMWNKFCADIGIKEVENALLDYINLTRIDLNILKLAKNLIELKYITGIITANSSYRMREIIEHENLENYFQKIFISGEIGATKWNKEMFEHVLSKTKLQPENIVFIDNSERNLMVPGQLGMKTIYYEYKEGVDSFQELLKKLNDFGVKF